MDMSLMLGITNSLSQGRPLWWKGLLIGPGKMRLNFSSASVSPGPIGVASPAAISQEIRILVQFGSSHFPSPCLTHTYKIPVPISLSSERYSDILLLPNREGNVHTLCTPTMPMYTRFTPPPPRNAVCFISCTNSNSQPRRNTWESQGTRGTR